jgi:hypothetical protein
MQLDAESASTLRTFAARAAGSRILVVRGSVSTPTRVPVATTIAIVSDEDRLVLVGEDEDVGSGDTTHWEIAHALAEEGAVIEAGPVRFPLRGDVTIERMGETTLMIVVHHRRSNGALSGAVDRLILTVLYGTGL